jgi:hypothetical protein
MSTLATVGYGDVHPSSVDEKIYAMLGMVLGVTIFAYFMSSMAHLLATLNSGEWAGSSGGHLETEGGAPNPTL